MLSVTDRRTSALHWICFCTTDPRREQRMPLSARLRKDEDATMPGRSPSYSLSSSSLGVSDACLRLRRLVVVLDVCFRPPDAGMLPYMRVVQDKCEQGPSADKRKQIKQNWCCMLHRRIKIQASNACQVPAQCPEFHLHSVYFLARP